MTRILVADDHPAYRDAVELYLSRELPDAGLCFVDGVAGLAALNGQAFDLVLLDWFLAGGEGGDGLAVLEEAGITGPVAVLTGAETPEVLFDALSRGVAGFLPKTLPRAAFVAAVRLLLAGGTTVPAALALAMAGAEPGVPAPAPSGRLLTEREEAVLQGLMGGGSNKEIGRSLGMQEVTVKLHVRRILKKLDAKNRTDAVVRAQALGLLPAGAAAPRA